MSTCDMLPPPKEAEESLLNYVEERWYQKAAVDAFVNFTFTHQVGENAGIVIPTGTGKSVVIAKLVELALVRPENKIMVLTHVEELVRQNVQKFLAISSQSAPNGSLELTRLVIKLYLTSDLELVLKTHQAKL